VSAADGSGPARRLGVLGWPVAHSLSPRMHAAALAALGLERWRYQLLPLPPELFAETVRALPRAGFAGANVTIPHKRAALEVADEASARARAIGAANTLTFSPDGAIAAENTDAPGLIAAIADMLEPQPLAGRSALVLGAGGSARAAVWALLDAGAADVAIWARRPERARALAEELGGRAVARPQAADLLVNCTPVGLERAATGAEEGPKAALEQSSSEEEALNQLGMALDGLHEYSNVVDLVYRTGGTPLLAAARRLGLRTLGGAEILVRQGALSLRLWTGLEPPLDVMRAAVDAERG
jgi:shikimate dehydrogenase